MVLINNTIFCLSLRRWCVGLCHNPSFFLSSTKMDLTFVVFGKWSKRWINVLLKTIKIEKCSPRGRVGAHRRQKGRYSAFLSIKCVKNDLALSFSWISLKNDRPLSLNRMRKTFYIASLQFTIILMHLMIPEMTVPNSLTTLANWVSQQVIYKNLMWFVAFCVYMKENIFRFRFLPWRIEKF